MTLFVAANFAQSKMAEKKTRQTDSVLAETAKWFAAWETVSRDFYKIDRISPVEFVFFDEKYVYSTSDVSVPDGELIDGPKLFDKKLAWKRAVHNGKLTLPNNQTVPVGLMSFASQLENKNAFFVMPLPEFWKKAGVESKELGLENLVTGVFLHEFSHTQQMQNFGSKISEYERKYKFETELSDDIIQDYFEKDADYNSIFREEVKLFYDAATENDKTKAADLIKESIEKLRLRQNKYFISDKAHFREIDDFFLTMEGFGQFTMYLWLTSPQGAKILPEIALKGVRRSGKQWSQEEGLALFLLLNKLSKPKHWARSMFGNKTQSVIELISKSKKISK